MLDYEEGNVIICCKCDERYLMNDGCVGVFCEFCFVCYGVIYCGG